MKERLTPQMAQASLARSGRREFVSLFRHGSLEIEFYKPDGIDLQQPHERDEVYVVIAGSGQFVKGTERVQFQPGEILFVPARTEHHFENFTDDFATWVFFYGPDGGERTGGKPTE